MGQSNGRRRRLARRSLFQFDLDNLGPFDEGCRRRLVLLMSLNGPTPAASLRFELDLEGIHLL